MKHTHIVLEFMLKISLLFFQANEPMYHILTKGCFLMTLYHGEWKVAHLCPTLCEPMDYTVHGILQARILEWVAFPFSRGFSNPGIEPRSLQADSLPGEPQGKPKNTGVGSLFLLWGSSQPRNRTRVSCIAGRFFTSWATREAKCVHKPNVRFGIINLTG